MSTPRKILCLVFCCLFLSILLPVLLDYQEVSGWDFRFLSWSKIPILNFYLPRYIFWASLLAVFVLFIALLAVIFYPNTYLFIPLAEADGQLSLKKSAIEGFVRSLIEENGYIKDGTVKAVLYKKRCRIQVEGRVLARENIIRSSRVIQEEIVSGMDQFFGISHPVKLDVRVSDISHKTGTKRSSRVR